MFVRCFREPSERGQLLLLPRRTNEPSRLLRLSRASRHDDDNGKSNRNKMRGLPSSLSAVPVRPPYRRSPPKSREARGRRAQPIRVRSGLPAESFPARRRARRTEGGGGGSVVFKANCVHSSLSFFL